MKKRTIIVLISVLAVLVLAGAACIAIASNLGNIPDRVISKRDLASINKVWIAEFGTEFASTPEEAMKRSKRGDFYFGKYGKTWVFFDYRYTNEKTYNFGEREFVLPKGELYFVTDKKVYTLEEFTEAGIFTDAQIAAFCDYCTNVYPKFEPKFTLPRGDYVLTAEDLIRIQTALGGEAKSRPTPFYTLESAMQRKRGGAYYFGKFGDTVIVWRNGGTELVGGFEWSGLRFDFILGKLYLYENGKVYSHTEAIEANIMTHDEIEAFHTHFTERFVPFNTVPYSYPEFAKGLEKLTESEMREVNEAYEKWKYDYYFNEALGWLKNLENAEAAADHHARSYMGYNPHRFFNEEDYTTYQYYGKLGSKIFLSTQGSTSTFRLLEIDGKKFFVGGSDGDILVYENGKLEELDKAYVKGTATKADVAFAHERHLAYIKYLLGGREEIDPPRRLNVVDPYKEAPIKLTEEEEREIVWEYIADESNLVRELGYSYAVRCYGKFGSVYVVMLDGPWMYGQVLSEERVAGYTFTFPDSQRLKVYSNGAFYTLELAYEMNVLSRENIAAIEWTKTETKE